MKMYSMFILKKPPTARQKPGKGKKKKAKKKKQEDLTTRKIMTAWRRKWRRELWS
jgi:hypothetical protein